jgi:hypothetical protein
MIRKRELINNLAKYLHRDKKFKDMNICKKKAGTLIRKYGIENVRELYTEVKGFKSYVVIEVIEEILKERC